MKSQECEGFPEIGCPDNADAMYDMLGYALCEKCAANWRKAPTREDQHAGAEIIALQAQIAELETRLAEYRSINALATATLEKYGERFGALS